MKLGYWLYRFARSSAKATGIAGPLRASFGPSFARFIFNKSTGTGQSVSVNGHQMVLAAEGQYPPFAMATDKYEVGTTRLLTKIIKPGMVIIDVGAHVGYFTLLAARQVGETGKVYSFEPDPTNHRMLLSNIQANGYTNIIVSQRAVSNTKGQSKLILSPRDNGTHSLFGQSNQDAENVPVYVISLDEFLTGENWPEIDLLKMDIEGSEMAALEGMNQLFRESPNLKMVIEFNPSLLQNALVDPLAFLTKLSEVGFKVSVIDNDDGTTPLQEKDYQTLTDSLLKSECSINLYCLKQ